MHLVSMRSPFRVILFMAVIVSTIHLISFAWHDQAETVSGVSTWRQAWNSAVYSRWSAKTTDTFAAWFYGHPPNTTPPPAPPPPPGKQDDRMTCLEAKGLQDIVFILKTGSTEIEEKLPVHLRTTVKCWPNIVLFSDYEEVFEGYTVHDALANVTEDIRNNDPHFELWRRLKEKGRQQALDPSELSTHTAAVDPDSKTGKPEVIGWGLDKFKFVPMIGKTLELSPVEAKWFVFAEVDTFVSWSNVLNWLSRMDYDRPVYLGSQAVIGKQEFGHGGSGFVLSKPAMQLVADLYRDEQRVWDQKAADNWAGDCVLAMALEHVGVKLSWSVPIIQGGDPTIMDFQTFGYDRKLWCYPAGTYHHVSPQTVEEMWYLEQDWTSHKSADFPMRHGDVFESFVMPNISSAGREDWDNGSGEAIGEVEAPDFESCRERCEGSEACLQYTHADATCKMYGKMMLGKKRIGYRSGWMMERIQHVVQEFGQCNDKDWEWIMPR